MKLVIPKRQIKISDVFSTALYTGNGATQDIATGINLGNYDGLVWAKNRDDGDAHILVDTKRGAGQYLSSANDSAEATDTDTITSINSDGFSIGADVKVNTNAENYVSWTFRRARKFFDIVSYTGDGTEDRTISHNLQIQPGMIIVKAASATGHWKVWHKDILLPGYFKLNTTDAFISTGAPSPVAGTVDSFVVHKFGVEPWLENTSGVEYIAYLFAHDTSEKGLIQSGMYTGNGLATGPEISLGWKPQFLLVKKYSDIGAWYIYDSVRDSINPRTHTLSPNSTGPEITAAPGVDFTASGFQIKSADTFVNENTATYIYLAIREA